MSEVTTEDAKRFLGEACRNWSYLRFNKDDLEDVRASLQRYRETAVAELRVVAQRYLDAQKAREQWPDYDTTKRFDAMLQEIDNAEASLVAALSQKETSHDD